MGCSACHVHKTDDLLSVGMTRVRQALQINAGSLLLRMHFAGCLLCIFTSTASSTADLHKQYRQPAAGLLKRAGMCSIHWIGRQGQLMLFEPGDDSEPRAMTHQEGA